MEKLNYDVDKSLKSIYSEDTNSLQIVFQGGTFDINNNKIRNWVGNGGTLIYLTGDSLHNATYGILTEENGNIKEYKYNKGAIITADANDVSNCALVKKTDKAYKLLMQINKYSSKKIYINENHLYSSSNNSSLWEYIPMSVKLIFCQLIISLIVYIYFKYKRIGKINPFADETGRTENEYLYCAATILGQKKCWDLMLDNYYRNFLDEIGCSDEGWTEYWKKEKLLHFHKAKKAYKFMHNNKKNIEAKDYMKMVKIFDDLSSIIKNQKNSCWGTLKRTI